MRGPETKKDFYRRFLSGEFGNTTFTTNCLADIEDRPEKLWAIRSKKPGYPCHYNLTKTQLRAKIAEMPDTDLNFSAMAPESFLLFQGEACLTESGLCLLYSTVKKPMRQSLAERSQQISGLAAVHMCQSRMWPNSYSWFLDLLKYDNTVQYSSVVEFSTYSIPVGAERGHNTVFWEVRNY